jgi:hypothetical protein
MDEPYQELLHEMGIALERLANKVPPPRRVPFASSFVFRYVEQTAQQAIIQKLSRFITGLRAELLLLRNGLLQEQGVIERVLDELREDITFLVYGILNGELDTKWHKLYLEWFYEEEFDDPESPFNSTQKRPMVPRDKIQAYLARIKGVVGNPSDSKELFRTLSKAFSGYVHCASPQIMETYGGIPPQFHVYGMLGTSRMEPHEKHLWYYFDRGVTAFIFAAIVFGDRELFDYLSFHKQKFAKAMGRELTDDNTDYSELLNKKPQR